MELGRIITLGLKALNLSARYSVVVVIPLANLHASLNASNLLTLDLRSKPLNPSFQAHFLPSTVSATTSLSPKSLYLGLNGDRSQLKSSKSSKTGTLRLRQYLISSTASQLTGDCIVIRSEL